MIGMAPIMPCKINAITPKNINNQSFTSGTNNTQPELKTSDSYNDPLMKWPVRGLAYSNELGAAISEIAPKLGMILWFPAMLYFGADIYDKYKNDKTSYNPDAMRGTSQAIFQLLASVVLPTAAVITGQKIASIAGSLGKSGLTYQTQEEISKFSISFMQRRKLGKYQNDVSQYKTEFFDALDTQMKHEMGARKIKNPLKILTEYIWTRRHPEAMAMSTKDKVHQFAEAGIDRMFKIREKLMKNEKPAEFSQAMFDKFLKYKEKFAKNPEFAKYNAEFAASEILKNFENSQIFRAKMLKTVGGFIALGLAIKPIDLFVEKVIMKKYIDPNLNALANSQISNYKNKTINKV